MLINKNIILRVLSGLFFFGITTWVLGPILLDYLKKRMPGHSSNETDIDTMIRRQKELLRSQYGLSGDINNISAHHNSVPIEHTELSTNSNHKPITPSGEIKLLYHETRWGGGNFVKELQIGITKNFSYTLSDNKINAFILLCEKKSYLYFLSEENRNSKTSINNYLTSLLVFFLIIDEVKEKTFYILTKIAKKLHVSPEELALALQIKLLMTVSSLNKGIHELKEERIFADILTLNEYSEETIKVATEVIAKKEANLWSKDLSLFFEELTLVLNYSSMLKSIPKLKNKNDIDTACEILEISKNATLEEIKKTYKKIALQKHPDKIMAKKLPKVLEKKGIEKFKQIQEAYEVMMSYKKQKEK